MRLFLLFLLCSTLSAQETLLREVLDPKTDTHIEVVALFSRPSPAGYLPVRVKIANNLDRDKSAQLEFTSGMDYSSRGSKTQSSFDFAAPAGKTVTADILVPLSPPQDRYAGGSLVSLELRGSMGESRGSLSGNFDSSQPAVLLSEALFTPNASSLDSFAATRYGGSSRYRGSSEFAAKFDPKQLPDDWRAFSGYDSLLLLDRDWTNTPAGARNAILSWVRLGGQLIVFSPTSATAASLGLPDDPSFGLILIEPIPPDHSLDAETTLNLVSIETPYAPQQVSLNGDYDGSWPLQDRFGTRSFRYELFILVLILFAVLVGPVNLFVFAKSGKRHKLFLTTPVISLGASLVLIALILFQDGFGGSGYRLQLMEVRPDGGQNAAYLHQEQISRTGVLARTSFTLQAPVAIQPVRIAQTRWARYTNSHDSQGSFHLQPLAAGTAQASGDWFQSRSEQGHALSAVVSTRGRIERTDTPDTLLSTFEFPIDTLYYLDENRQWHRAEHIATGKRFALTPVDAGTVEPVLTEQRAWFTKRHSRQLQRVSDRPGCFLAVTTHAPGIDTHPGIRWKETKTILTGPVIAP